MIGSEKPRRDNSGAKSGTWLNDGWSGKDGDGSCGGYRVAVTWGL